MTKRILITGKSSYIGNKFIEWIEESNEDFHIDTISVRDNSWKEMNFARYDTILHLAGIAHVSKDPNMEELYYAVNRDLTISLAEKAKKDGVKQFIFMSSIIVYGDGVGADGLITEKTIPKPRDFYGNSKLQAEDGIRPFSDDSFNVAIIRPPMIYGKGSKGNYPKLARLALKLPLFPDYENQRSMIYIDNLSNFIKMIICEEENGLFFPQNEEFVKTSNMVKVICEMHNNKIKFTRICNPLIKFIASRIIYINKIFGNLKYSYELSEYKLKYQIIDFKESIKSTEIGE
ncbi:UDP-glucose 4-epimerase [Alkalihalobacillus xiaoxiensis]|uniref:UDP-glucose 4-epimerase n=1 Tax=Shouchella xiaoxiensis TaxID=766895 RepID=A0ABS2SXC5_9BACI|nr:NAD-dependent epimerase/dehydratase family protein [Shouchella xiaoxiensis]MBM7839415.1 UDP-glucose 4-epimerase [Shouchella xiaoxiensis]